MTSLLLLLGPAGVGKTTLLHLLRERDSRFRYISPFATRPLRLGEADKISVTNERLDELDAAGELLVINHIYGVRYGTPRAPIARALDEGLFPMLDWPIKRIGIMEDAFPGRLFRVYVEPPGLEVLERRLRLRGDPDAHLRLSAAEEELADLRDSEFSGHIDLRITSADAQQSTVADAIYTAYITHVRQRDTEKTK